jgi:hypothetical protein
VIEERGTPETLLLRRHRLLAPELLIAECANILWNCRSRLWFCATLARSDTPAPYPLPDNGVATSSSDFPAASTPRNISHTAAAIISTAAPA